MLLTLSLPCDAEEFGVLATDGQMKAAVVHEIGQVPRYERFAAPVAGDDDVVVTVAASALKPSDRLMVDGVHYAPDVFPQVVGLDGVGRLEDGTRVAFLIPQRPYGGMAEKTLVRRGMWLPVPDAVDDITAAAFLNPGMAAWKTISWEGELTSGQSVLVLGATGSSGRIATQLAVSQGGRVVAAGRNQAVLDQLLERGAADAIRVDLPRDELIDAVAAHGPYDLVVDYLWGAPAEAVFAALPRASHRPSRTRYILVGMTAGYSANVPAPALRHAPILLSGSGVGGSASLNESAAAFADLLERVAAGDITLEIRTGPLAEVETVWSTADTGYRTVFVP